MSEYIAPDSPDPDVIALTTQFDAILLTIDLDFANILDYPPAKYGGIIVLRYAIVYEAQLDTTLKIALEDLSREDIRGTLIIVTSQRYRIRH